VWMDQTGRPNSSKVQQSTSTPDHTYSRRLTPVTIRPFTPRRRGFEGPLRLRIPPDLAAESQYVKRQAIAPQRRANTIDPGSASVWTRSTPVMNGPESTVPSPMKWVMPPRVHSHSRHR